MFNLVVLAHEEGVGTGPESWLGPILLLIIIAFSIILGKVVKRRR